MFTREKLHYRALPLEAAPALSDDESMAAARAFFARMKTRHTVRDFSPRPVDGQVIADCIATAGRAPSGANHQPWHFVAVRDPDAKREIRTAAEQEEEAFYGGGASDEWIKALEPLGTGVSKPHLEIAPWLLVVFAQRWGEFDDGTRYKNYYVPESVGIACGFLIAALHHAGLSCLTHTPNPMAFLNGLLARPKSEKPVMIIAAGYPAQDATIPQAATIKKPLEEIMTVV
ncbi:nitroreductase family protein [Salaquimonas pukyongi]|uniref:nitroreductase family protein n=1 Tax=Salaquimonas pukyongi TaxID=2712698 RepID=UPI00096BA2A5|nr:nitroreductase family protein [Salaquimonas pukyongi]